MNIEMRSLDAICPYARNPLVIPKKAIEKVAASLEAYYGWQQPASSATHS